MLALVNSGPPVSHNFILVALFETAERENINKVLGIQIDVNRHKYTTAL